MLIDKGESSLKVHGLAVTYCELQIAVLNSNFL